MYCTQDNTISPKLFRVIKIKQPKQFGFDLTKASLREMRFFACISSRITSVIQVTANIPVD